MKECVNRHRRHWIVADPDFIGLVERVKDTRKGPKLMLRVVRGSLAEGDEVEIVHADGSSQRSFFLNVGKRPLTPESTLTTFRGGQLQGHWHRQDGTQAGVFREGDLLRAPDASPLQVEGTATDILADIAAARARGSMKRGTHLPDAVIALYLQHCMESALRGSSGTMTMGGEFGALGDTLEAHGLTEQADRARLTASAVLEQYEPGPSVRGLASVAAGVVNAPATFRAPLLVRGIGLALEEGDTFAASYSSGVRATGEGMRLPLQREGRAVALAWCGKCHDVRRLDTKLKCETCGKRLKDAPRRVVVPADVPRAEVDLREDHNR